MPVCTVTDNPAPVEFKLSAIGSTPKLAIVDDASKVTFERLLLNRADNKRITLASRSALPLAWKVRADDLAAVERVSDLIDAIGFDVVHGGGLAESWRIERDTPGYIPHFTAEQLRQKLAEATRQPAA